MITKTAFKKWFFEIDKIHLSLIFILMIVGCYLVLSASPAVAIRLKLTPLFFFKRHLFYLGVGAMLLLFFSMIPDRYISRISLVMYILMILLLLAIPILGTDVKGAKRWINIAGFSLQPSELLKPFYIVILARIAYIKNIKPEFPIYYTLIFLQIITVGLIIIQPDLGMSISYMIIFATTIFLTGISLFWIPIMMICGAILLFIAYLYFPHVTYRIDSFLNGGKQMSYQVEKSLQSHANGGLFGQGPLGGSIKNHLPDSHTDFIFAVAGEELGIFLTALLIILIMLIAIRGIIRTLDSEDLYKNYVIIGISVLFAFQSIFNMGVTLNIFPTKGMTLPFISYGGSATFSNMIAFGILINFTRKKFGILGMKI